MKKVKELKYRSNSNGINNVTIRCKGTITWEDFLKQMVISYINNNKIIEE